MLFVPPRFSLWETRECDVTLNAKCHIILLCLCRLASQRNECSAWDLFQPRCIIKYSLNSTFLNDVAISQNLSLANLGKSTFARLLLLTRVAPFVIGYKSTGKRNLKPT